MLKSCARRSKAAEPPAGASWSLRPNAGCYGVGRDEMR
jgi:hypothetical protein